MALEAEVDTGEGAGIEVEEALIEAREALMEKKVLVKEQLRINRWLTKSVLRILEIRGKLKMCRINPKMKDYLLKPITSSTISIPYLIFF